MCDENNGDKRVEISQKMVESIAELAKLQLTNDEITLYAGQLTEILKYFEKIQNLDTSHIASTASVLPITNVLRIDEAGTPLSTDEVIANAPDSYDNQFRVSAVLDE